MAFRRWHTAVLGLAIIGVASSCAYQPMPPYSYYPVPCPTTTTPPPNTQGSQLTPTSCVGMIPNYGAYGNSYGPSEYFSANSFYDPYYDGFFDNGLDPYGFGGFGGWWGGGYYRGFGGHGFHGRGFHGGGFHGGGGRGRGGGGHGGGRGR